MAGDQDLAVCPGEVGSGDQQRDQPMQTCPEGLAEQHGLARPGQARGDETGHLAMEALKLATGMFITHIPFA